MNPSSIWMQHNCPAPSPHVQFPRGLEICYDLMYQNKPIEIRHAKSQEFYEKVSSKVQQMDESWQKILLTTWYAIQISRKDDGLIFSNCVCFMLQQYLTQSKAGEIYFINLPWPGHILQLAVTALLLEVDEEIEKRV